MINPSRRQKPNSQRVQTIIRPSLRAGALATAWQSNKDKARVSFAFLLTRLPRPRFAWARNDGLMKKGAVLAAMLCIVSVFTFLTSSVAFAGLFNPKTFTLKNGLQVVVLTNKRAPVVKQVLLYRAGAIDEPTGRSGIAHFLEHLMFKGTKQVSGEEFVKTIESLGGDQNAQTSRDYTLYYQEIAKEHLETIINLEADRMANLQINAKDVDTERPVILEERRMRIDNEPSAILVEAVNATYFENHPYRLPSIGWEHEMQKLTHEDAMKFYNSWYAPNNAILVFAGDITVEEVKPLVEKYYGVIPAKVLPERNKLEEPVHRGIVKQVIKRSDRVLHPLYMRIYGAPNFRDNPKAVYALEVLRQILSNGANSLLYNELVTKKKVAVSASMNYMDPMARGPSTFYFIGQPAPGKEVRALELALVHELKKIVLQGINSKEVEQAKERLVADLAYTKDESFGGATLFAQCLGSGYKVEDIEDWETRIRAVTTDEVNTYAREVFTQDSYLTARLLPLKKEKTHHEKTGS